jgi:uncharacterized protein YndB with AHSA1/START domain
LINEKLIAKVATTTNVSVAKVWDTLTSPAAIKKFMFGTEVVSEWKQGSSIIWKGLWEGKSYQDKGVILTIEPPRILQYTHFSPLSGVADIPENYHTLTFELSKKGDETLIELSQDNNSSEEDLEHSKKMWESLLVSLKKVLEENQETS